MTDERIRRALEAADDAFWAKVVEFFPEAKSGDFPIDATLRWSATTERAVRLWVDLNVEGN